ncbi:161_t:CDS:2, partial [Entrophospora sp. SA101]
ALSRRLSSKKLISKETTIEKIKKQHEDSVIVRTVIPLNDVQYNLEIFLVKNKYTGQKVDFERNHHRE